MNYEQDIKIDPDALDVEWLQQASLMLKYCKIATEAKKEMDLAKEKLDIVRSELDNQIRKDPEGFKIEKVTEAAIQNAILLLAEYQEANGEYLSTKYEFDMANNAVRALEMKKSALENLVKLYGQQYFAGPKIPRDLNKEWEQKQRQSNSNVKIATKMTRNK